MGNENSSSAGGDRGASFGSIRDRDETGHRTGLGTLARAAVSDPVGTAQAIGAFKSNYDQMKQDNVRGGNLRAHEQANYEATKATGNANVAAALSAAREQSKTFRGPASTSPAATKGWGDMRTAAEVKATMDANTAGRERALGEK